MTKKKAAPKKKVFTHKSPNVEYLVRLGGSEPTTSTSPPTEPYPLAAPPSRADKPFSASFNADKEGGMTFHFDFHGFK